ncbi:hypothetical protein QEJ31_09455 [Pigmentibacter sp. JX0631]|uniref:hypothetical protein n=1 Tax=Pigmentibacter sp. JX0631 TaxID=2976982 RepID=UPI002468E1BD|nr:hypothetical protein [Pigmentibacter sp. JX0631]WGL58750.1 hypothetical protein QEJ31_09455 [Pigmentibacter sp. JX0631]
MKNFNFFIIIALFFLAQKNSFAFTEIQECFRWVLGSDITKKLDSVNSKESKKLIIENAKKNSSQITTKKLDACLTLFSDYQDPKDPNKLLGNPMSKAVCCNCSGWCAAGWILVAYCSTCVSINGGEGCCSSCKMPAGPGQSCN